MSHFEVGDVVLVSGRVERYVLDGAEAVVQAVGKSWVRCAIPGWPCNGWVHSFPREDVRPKPAPVARAKAKVRRR